MTPTLCPVCGNACEPRRTFGSKPWAFLCYACCPDGYVRLWPDYLFPIVPKLDDDLIKVLGVPMPLNVLSDIDWLSQEGAVA